ncbi:MAG: amidoligase family protein, partial [Bacillota bacterium]
KDIETIQEIVRKLRGGNAIVNSSAGVHVHVGCENFNATQVRNFVNIMSAREDMIYKALQVQRGREESYCQKLDPDFVEALNKKKPKTLEEIGDLWYQKYHGDRNQHYHSSRYHCLNLHSLFQKNTIEIRSFNSAMHAGKIKSYLQLCLGMAAQAHNQRSASPKKRYPENEKYAFRVWLLQLGLIGDEFKTARLHLMNHLEGNSAWKTQEQADAQKERLREELTEQESDPNQNQGDGGFDEEPEMHCQEYAMTM